MNYVKTSQSTKRYSSDNMERKAPMYNLYAEFLALRSIEHQLLSSVEQHLAEIPLGNIKLLVKLQKTMNNSIVRMVANVSDDMSQVLKKMKTMHSETPTTTTLTTTSAMMSPMPPLPPPEAEDENDQASQSMME